MRVLVTGATGFVGGNLARELSQRGNEVLALVRSGSSTLTIQDTQVQQVPGDILDAADNKKNKAKADSRRSAARRPESRRSGAAVYSR